MKKVNFIAKSAIIAGLYVVFTLLLAPISYGAVQFRLSEVLVLLVLLNPKYGFALVIGCLVSNISSPMGMYDVFFGTLATLVSVVIMSRIKKVWIGAMIPVICNAFIIAIELGFAYDLFQVEAFFYNVLTIGLGEFVVLYFVGLPLVSIIKRNSKMCELLDVKVE